MKLIPASSARWMIWTDSSWSLLPQSPNIIAPRQRGLTYMPVAPRVRCSIRRGYPLESAGSRVRPADERRRRVGSAPRRDGGLHALGQRPRARRDEVRAREVGAYGVDRHG